MVIGGRRAVFFVFFRFFENDAVRPDSVRHPSGDAGADVVDARPGDASVEGVGAIATAGFRRGASRRRVARGVARRRVGTRA